MEHLLLDEIGQLPYLSGGSSFRAYRYGNHALKVGDVSDRADTLEGTRRLQAAGIPVLPVEDEWETGGMWVYSQPLVVPLSNPSPEDAARGLDVMRRGAEAGVFDLWSDNVAYYKGQLCVFDPTMLSPVSAEAEESCAARWLSLQGGVR